MHPASAEASTAGAFSDLCLAMNDDPTQLFPETHWKRYATEAVSTPSRQFGRVIPAEPTPPIAALLPALRPLDAQKLERIQTQPLLS